MIEENKSKPELLIPAGSLEVLKVAVDYGADAVYIGGDAYGLRAKAHNFSPEEMRQGIEYAHSRGVKVHVTVNILAHNADLAGARDYLKELSEIHPDALIIADPGLFTMARELCPDIDIHISTQANNTNYETFNFWYRLGARRVVCGRELSLSEIREIREHIPEDMEIECFIHGSMCISYSGRCLLSNFFTGRDANRGECTHPCRWKYAVMEETRPGEYYPVYENDRGTYIFNSKDLCMVEHIPDLVEAGVNSFKIEGRMKNALYVATVARTYRLAIDMCMEDPEAYEAHMDWFHSEIAKCTYRQYTTGFYYVSDKKGSSEDKTAGSGKTPGAGKQDTTTGNRREQDTTADNPGKPGPDTQIYDESTYTSDYIYLGRISEIDDEYAGFEQKNKFSVGDVIEIMKPDGENVSARVLGMKDETGSDIDSCPHASTRVSVRLSTLPSIGDIMRIAADSIGR